MFVVIALTGLLAACKEEAEAPPAPPRQVRSVIVEQRQASETVALTGRIEAEDEIPLAFRISGRVLENNGKLGERMQKGDLVARLESQNEENQLRAEAAGLSAAEAQYNQARGNYERQRTLFRQGWATRANFELAEKGMKTAAAGVEAAEARLSAAEDLLGFTELRADQDGVYTAVGPSAGEVVQAGQMIVRVARQDGRDAVFAVPSQIIRSAPADPVITVTLADDPSVSVIGHVREVAPQADPVTGTFEVKVSLDSPPEAMRLGATVNGSMQATDAPVIEIPAGALTRSNQQPAVWVVDPKALTVSLRPIDIERHGESLVAVSSGLAAGDIVVTAGVQALHAGQMVRLMDSAPWRLQSLGMGAEEPLDHGLPDDHRRVRRTCFLLPAGAERGSVLHHQDNGGAGGVARRHVEETLKQVTERLERTLQETPNLDFLRSFTRAGVTTIFVNLDGNTNAKEIADTWYHVRKSIGDMRHTLPAGVVGPGLQ